MTEHEYLTFMIAGEEYGIDILCVQEIRVLSQLTELPKKPDYIKGVINLRGTIIPIIDLRTRFNHATLVKQEKTVVIILKHQADDAPGCLGIIVDSVSEVYNFNEKDINKAPSFGGQIDNCFIRGLASFEDKLIILIDTHQLLDIDVFYQESNGRNMPPHVNKDVL